MSIFKPSDVIKIVAIGPESTGKSTLCGSLADHFSTIWCKEYARAYLLENGMAYSFDDLLTIAEGQLQLEEEAISNCIELHNQQGKSGRPILFIDTDMYVMKVWCEFVFGKCHPQILKQIVARKYDGYLLCKPDLPWVNEELREYPDLATREILYHHYKDLLVHQSTPWFEVTGNDPERMNGTVRWINALIKP
jgi:NadR type nicotinamide-nucleotide adenylyltransferase